MIINLIKNHLQRLTQNYSNCTKKNGIKRYFIGDGCLGWSLGDNINQNTSHRVLGIYRALKNAGRNLDILDIVPSYNAVAVHFDPSVISIPNLCQAVEKIIGDILLQSTSNDVQDSNMRQIVIPVIYDGEDLTRISLLTGLSAEEVVQLHVDSLYTVAMVGFLPHFPYLIGLDKRLETPRLDSPRKKVPAGSVGIGGEQTGIYPCVSPGGWNILGRTDPELLKSIKPGDRVKFKNVKML